MTKTVNSFAALGEAWNEMHKGKRNQVRPQRVIAEKPRKCRVCGADMEHIVGSNVYVCKNMIEVPTPTEENPDAKEQKVCGNFALAR